MVKIPYIHNNNVFTSICQPKSYFFKYFWNYIAHLHRGMIRIYLSRMGNIYFLSSLNWKYYFSLNSRGIWPLLPLCCARLCLIPFLRYSLGEASKVFGQERSSVEGEHSLDTNATNTFTVKNISYSLLQGKI